MSETANLDDTAPRRRVLVVDDSVLIREAAKVALGQFGGCEVATATSGEDGLDRAAGDPPDAILLDVEMPGMGGIATAHRLASTPATSHVPIVLLTARDGPEDRTRFALLPVSGVIAKPFAIPELAGQLGALLRW